MRVVFYDCGYETFGVQYLISVLKGHGHEVFLFFDSSYSKDYLAQDFFLTGFFSLNADQVADGILAAQPDAVCFSLYTIFYQDSLAVMRRLRRRRPGLVIICGGFHATLLPEKVLENGDVDFVIRGEAELSLPRLLERIKNDGAERAKSLPRGELPGVGNRDRGAFIERGLSPVPHDLDSLPFPEKEMYYRTNPSLERIYTVIASRGCPYECTYCNSATMNKLYLHHREKYYRVRSVENVIRELETAVEKHRPRYVMFFDDVFGAKKEWLAAFAAAYREKIGLPFYCQTSPLIHDEESLRLLASSGCCLLEFGFQSANASVRREILHRREENADVRNLVLEAKRQGMFTELDLIANLPGETYRHLEEALAFARETRPHWVNLAFLQFHPKTAIIDIAVAKGALPREEVERIEAGKRTASMRLLSRSGLGKQYRLLPFQMFFAFAFPRPLSRVLMRLVEVPVLSDICSRTASFFLYASRILVSYFDRRDFLIRHHVVRSWHAGRWVLARKRAPHAG